ncbi:hypothetical protein [Alteromonas macleodii]|nr:hypothetical protein [Alteromonas macleodii]
MLIQACSRETVVNVPEQVAMPAGYMIETELVDTSPSHSVTVLKVVSLGGVPVTDCLLFGKTIRNASIARAAIEDPKLSCDVTGSPDTKQISGYVVDHDSQYAGLPFSCKGPGDCQYLTEDAVFIVTETVDMGHFSFLTTEPVNTVSFRF